MDKLLDIKDFQLYSSVSDTDRVLMVKGATGTDASITIGLLKTVFTDKLLLPSIKDGVWFIGDKSTGINAVGKSPIIKDQIWWIWDEEKNDYVSSGQSVNSAFVLTKEAIEGLLVGNINSHEHIRYTVPTLSEKPNEETLTWTDENSNLYDFYVGQLCRVIDSNEELGYKFYQLYNIADGKAIWGEISGKGGVGQTYPNTINGEIFNDYTNNVANGKNAHAEGQETNATGPRAHAEGYLTNVFAAEGHAEGRETACIGSQGHVEGMYGISIGANSHVEGTAARIVLGSYDVSVDTKPILKDIDTIRTIIDNYKLEVLDNWEITIDVEKLLTDYFVHCSFGERNHVEGVNNVVFSNCCHVEGVSNIVGDRVSGHSSSYKDHGLHVEGCFNEVYILEGYRGVHVEGVYNKIVEESTYQICVASHIEGGSNTIVNSSYSHVSGQYCNINNASHTFAHGYYLNCNNKFEAAFGKFNASEVDGKKVLFAYGIGTSDTDRKNAISVFEDGSVSIPNLTGVTGIDEKIAELQSLLNDKLIGIYNKLSTDGITSPVFVINDTLIITNRVNATVSETDVEINDEMFIFADGDLSYNANTGYLTGARNEDGNLVFTSTKQ